MAANKDVPTKGRRKGQDLLEQAKAVPRSKTRASTYTDEHFQLALAVARDEIGLGQFCSVTGKKTSSAYNMLWRIMQQGVRDGRLTVQ